MPDSYAFLKQQRDEIDAKQREELLKPQREFFCHWLARVYEAGHRDTSYEQGETLDSVLREVNQVLGFSGYEPESRERDELLKRKFAWNELHV